MIHSVFVYGTLKDESRRDDCYVYGTLYDLGPFPGIKLRGESQVPGQLIEVSDEYLGLLDKYEGVPTLYVRKQVPVVRQTPENLFISHAWIYEYNGNVDSFGEIDKW